MPRFVTWAAAALLCAALPLAALSAQRPVPCGERAGLPDHYWKTGSMVLFGEMHGVTEFPAFFAEAVCQAASRGRPVAVGLEFPPAEQVRVDAFLASKGRPEDRAALLGSTWWTRDYQDGRTSEAMALLLERLRQLRAAGARIVVFLFDSQADDRDADMARLIAERVSAREDRAVLVLTGNMHARTTQGVPWDEAFLPMGWHLGRKGFRVHALDFAAPPGTAWVCETLAPKDCGPRPYEPKSPEGKTGVVLSRGAIPGGFEGVYAVRSMTASRPAVARMPVGEAPPSSAER